MKKILLTGAIALGLVACSDNNESGDNGGGAQKGNTYASVSVSLKQSNGTKALTDSQDDNAGTNAEQNLAELLVLSSKSDQSFTPGAIDTDGAFWAVGQTYTTAPWKTEAGLQALALLFNKNSVAPGTANSTQTHMYEGAPMGLTTPNFTMSSAAFSANVKAGISKDNVAAGTDEGDNVFGGVGVERVVSKGIVRLTSDFDDKVKDGSGATVATMSDVTFAAVNGATKTFLYGDNAGERTLGTNAPDQYDGFTSAIHNIAPIENDQNAYNAGLVRLGIVYNMDITNGSTENAEVYKEKDVNPAGATPESTTTNAFYFLENSGKAEDAVKAVGYYRFAYAKVYATYTPTSLLEADKSVPADFIAQAGTTLYYKPKAGGGYEVADSSDPEAVEGFLVWKLKTVPGVAGQTFYKGAVDNILYASEEAAISSQVPGAARQGIYVYKDGRCGYRALWNRQVENKLVVNADARRNNTYMLSIQSFGKLGFPWDESDPEDPNLPKVPPTTPELPDPETPTDPDIEPKETYMRVIAEILPWNLVIRENVELH